MDELREAFVRARFAQEEFGKPDIAEWLAGQREAERPEYDRPAGESYWNTLFCTTDLAWRAENDSLTILRNCATESGVLYDLGQQRLPSDESPFERDTFIQFIPLFNSFVRSAVYYGHTDGAIVVALDHLGEPHPYTVREEDKGSSRHRLVVKPLHARAPQISVVVMDALFAEWLYGRPKWREARSFICNALTAMIKRARTAAEEDFDHAVTVSADGTKIVHADWVVVNNSKTTKTVLLFPGTAFHGQKIRRIEHLAHMGRYAWRASVTATALKRPAEMVAELYHRAFPPDVVVLNQAFGYLDGEGGAKESVLITVGEHCPSTLPDGGVEVAV